MLSLEEQIIDATTEEGRAALKKFEEQERASAVAGEHEPVPDPE
jgi:cell division cycle protein 37